MAYSALSQQLYYLSLGDEQAFRRVVQQFGDRLYQFARRMVEDPQDAEEIVSDVFFKIWQLREHLPEYNQFSFYLYRAVKHTALNYLKKQYRKKDTEWMFRIEVNRDFTQNPEEMVISKENLSNIQQAIDALPSRCRQIFVLVKEDGLSYREVAELLDISPATVNVQMTLAVKRLWQALDLALQGSPS